MLTQNNNVKYVVFALWVVFNGFLLSNCAATPNPQQLSVPKHTQIPKKYHKGQVYTMRGGLLGVFSTGMAILTDTLEKDYRIHSVTTVYHDATGLSSYLIQQDKAGKLPRPLILVGHSLGANEQIKVADALALAHIPVDLLITLDAGLPLPVPSNVKQLVNIYQPTLTPVFKGVPLAAVDSKRTRVENIDVSQIKGLHVNHFIISENPVIQKIMLQKILAVTA